MSEVSTQQRNTSTRLEDYFALKDGSELVNACMKKIEAYASHVGRTGRLATWKRAYKNADKCRGNGICKKLCFVPRVQKARYYNN